MKIVIAAVASLGFLAAAKPAAAQYANAQIVAPVYMRTGPAVGYPPVVVVPAYALVTVYGCINGWQWCDVSWGGYRGWVAAGFLRTQYLGQPAPYPYAAPQLGAPIISFIFGNYWDTHYRGRPWYQHRGRWNDWDNRHGYGRHHR